MADKIWQCLQHILALNILAATFVACGGSGRQVSQATIDSIASICREGDIVLREGNSMESRIVASADRHGSYTHCGIIARLGDSMVVVHAVPNEPDFEGDVDRVKAEPLRSFFSAQRAKGGCLLRCNVGFSVARNSARKAVEMFRRKTLFDHSYNAGDTTKMYCCELVEYAYRQSGVAIVGTGHHNFNMPGLKLNNVIFPSDFLRSARVRIVTSF